MSGTPIIYGIHRFIYFHPTSRLTIGSPASGRAVVVQALVRRLYLFYSSVVIFQNFIITPFTVSVYEFIGEVPWMLL